MGRRLIKEGILPIKQEIEKRRLTSEGWESVQSIYQICLERNIDAPIVTEVYKVIYEGKPAEEAAEAMVRLVKQREEERKQQKKKEKDKKKGKDKNKDKKKGEDKDKKKDKHKDKDKHKNGKNGGNGKGNGGKKKNGNGKNGDAKKASNGG